MHSKMTSGPAPVIRAIAAAGLCIRGSTAASAPSFRATSRRSNWSSETTIARAPENRAHNSVIRPIASGSHDYAGLAGLKARTAQSMEADDERLDRRRRTKTHRLRDLEDTARPRLDQLGITARNVAESDHPHCVAPHARCRRGNWRIRRTTDTTSRPPDRRDSKPVTPAPTLSTTPAISWPMMVPGRELRLGRSGGVQIRTADATSLDAGRSSPICTGSGSSTTSSGAPIALNTHAFIMVLRDSEYRRRRRYRRGAGL